MRLSDSIATLKPYLVGKSIGETQREYGLQKVIKLASNENPFGLSPMVKEALMGALQDQYRYPDPSFYELIESVSSRWGLLKERISVGNGSNEIIDILIRVYCEPGDFILTADKSFAAYAICAQAARVGCIFSPLKMGYQMDLEAMSQILRNDPRAQKIKLIFIANPNNPTGTYVSDGEVQSFLREFGNDEERLIIFDEAYTEYVLAKDYSSSLKFVNQYSNVVVIRTLSKAYGLAGLRVGILVALPSVIDYFNRVRNPFNVNGLAQVAAVAALQDHEFVRKSVLHNSQELEKIYQRFHEQGIPFTESQGNFVMFDTLRDVQEVYEELLKRGVILRPILNYGFKTEMRMSIGLPEENEYALAALKETFEEVRNVKLK